MSVTRRLCYNLFSSIVDQRRRASIVRNTRCFHSAGFPLSSARAAWIGRYGNRMGR